MMKDERNAPSMARHQPSSTLLTQIGHTMIAITEDLMLTLLGSGRSLAWIAEVSGWPGRQVRTFAARHGYLCTPAGTLYRPPGLRRAGV
jgi:hypothetical protein